MRGRRGLGLTVIAKSDSHAFSSAASASSVSGSQLILPSGGGVKRYKQKLAKRCGMKDYNQEKLCECPSDLK